MTSLVPALAPVGAACRRDGRYQVGRFKQTIKGKFIAAGLQRLDERLYRRFSREQGLFNATLVPLGKAADMSVLWMAIALVFAASGRRRGRRAALRGLLSLALTSALVNLPMKTVARRRRPEGTSVKTRFGRVPTTSSFPSGHSASAAAFATGVSVELPEATVPLGTLAAAVGASRVYAGVHYPTDVLAGALAGSAIAYGLKRFWPVADQEPAEARQAPTPADVMLRATGEGITFVVNATAGSALASHPAALIRRELPAAEVLVCESPDEFEAALKAASTAEVVGVAGGDGSINAAARVAYDHGLPLVVVPSGTLNHLTRDLGIDTAEESIEALRIGSAAAVDVGTIDGQIFLNTASFGSYVELVDAREALESRIGKWPAVLLALVRVLRRSRPIDVRIDGRPRTVWMIFIGNCRYKPSGFAPSYRPRLDDGLLDVRIVDGSHPWARTRLLLALLGGTLTTCPVYEQSLRRSMTVRSIDGRPLRLARDGETFQGRAEFKVGKLERPLAIYSGGQPKDGHYLY